ncbi:probable Xaa-Pro aminopeptidase SS1G_06948 [Phialocephala subalpina]|uniref:Xaa-Pro aminopeptidase n=1 Tax=Phialocephala subalpina TaxID=576137 RepID=A0A1L7WND2_9HELO|nr:probable Xaa-Pro aminopeptidase SS1G_06948 [Phialocephala subalpina]
MDIIPDIEFHDRPSSRASSIAMESIDMEEVGEEFVSVSLKPKPKQKYPAKLHAKSVAEHLGEKSGLIYLPGFPYLEYEDSDQQVFFRQRRYFYYLSGLDLPDCAVTYDIKTDRLVAFIPPPRIGRSIIYNGQNPSREEIKAIFDFDDVELLTNLDGYLANFAHHEPSSKIYLLHAYQRPTDFLRYMSMPDGSTKKVHFDSFKLQPAMDAARVIHSPYEITQIRKASAITARAHINVLRSVKALKNEAEIEAIFTATCIALQAKKQAYGVIAGAGVNASTLHYEANNEPLEGRQLVVLDAGCEWKCYASDVTRTFPISGRHTTESKAIYDIVEKMQEECIEMCLPGANYRDIQQHANEVAVEGLMELGLLQGGTFEELLKSGVVRAFFPHGLGHYMGLEVHDVGDGGNLLMLSNRKLIDWRSIDASLVNNPSAYSASILAPNQVITMEPGIYFSRYAIEEVALQDPSISKYINAPLLSKYYPVGGVRIEDDILITEDGYENLTSAPKGDEALKIINGEQEEGEGKVAKKQKKRWLW